MNKTDISYTMAHVGLDFSRMVQFGSLNDWFGLAWAHHRLGFVNAFNDP